MFRVLIGTFYHLNRHKEVRGSNCPLVCPAQKHCQLWTVDQACWRSSMDHRWLCNYLLSCVWLSLIFSAKDMEEVKIERCCWERGGPFLRHTCIPIDKDMKLVTG